MSGHTPGPWYRGGCDGTDIRAANGVIVASCWTEPGVRSASETDANACLIAAVPEMAARLKEVEAQRDALADALLVYVRQGRAALASPFLNGSDPSVDLLTAEAALRAAGRLP